MTQEDSDFLDPKNTGFIEQEKKSEREGSVGGFSASGVRLLLGVCIVIAGVMLAGRALLGSFGGDEETATQAELDPLPPKEDRSQKRVKERNIEDKLKRLEQRRKTLADKLAQAEAKEKASTQTSSTPPSGAAPQPMGQGQPPSDQVADPSPYAQARQQYRMQLVTRRYERRLNGSMKVARSAAYQQNAGSRAPAGARADAVSTRKPETRAEAFERRLAATRSRAEQQARMQGGQAVASPPALQLPTSESEQRAFFTERVTRPGAAASTEHALSGPMQVPVVLVTGINTDLPGRIYGVIPTDVYDRTLTRVVVEKGTYVLGSYNASMEFGQERIQARFDTLVFHDGRRVTLGNVPVVSPNGMAGTRAKVDMHLPEILVGGALSALIGAGTGAAAGPQSALAVRPEQTALLGAGQAAGNIGDKWAGKYLELEPTLRLGHGTLVAMQIEGVIPIPRQR